MVMATDSVSRKLVHRRSFPRDLGRQDASRIEADIGGSG